MWSLAVSSLFWLAFRLNGVSSAVLEDGAQSLSACPDTSRAVYDYVIIGSGAGGGPLAARLAESGFSVLVVETGKDFLNANTTAPLLASFADEDPNIDLNYTVNEYPAGFRIQRNDEWYPRAAAIGGCTIHNGLVNSIAGMHNTLNSLSRTFNDSSWNRDNMQNFLKLIERNLYLQPNTSAGKDHGFDGWLSTTRIPETVVTDDPEWQAITSAFLNSPRSKPLIQDINGHLPLPPSGGRGLSSSTMTAGGNRSSIRDRLVAVAGFDPSVELAVGSHSKTSNLTLMMDTLATKVLLCKLGSSSKTQVKAYGVSIAPGGKLAIAKGYKEGVPLKEKTVIARREVIVSAGVYESPRLLMLSGIGDQAQLQQHGITPVVHLPGVGTNLQDNDEIPVVWKLKQNITGWVPFGDIFVASPGSSNVTGTEPDIDVYSIPVEFTGFKHGFAALGASTPNFFSSIPLKARASSRGYVRLTSPSPQARLDINKLRFQGPGGEQNIADLREAVKTVRKIMQDPGVQAFIDEEAFPGEDVNTDDELDQYVLENVYGHHGCCTNPIGPDDNPQAVLDQNFRVRGVGNLRVVDASSWPEAPWYYPTTPTYMIAEKAAVAIMAESN